MLLLPLLFWLDLPLLWTSFVLFPIWQLLVDLSGTRLEWKTRFLNFRNGSGHDQEAGVEVHFVLGEGASHRNSVPRDLIAAIRPEAEIGPISVGERAFAHPSDDRLSDGSSGT